MRAPLVSFLRVACGVASQMLHAVHLPQPCPCGLLLLVAGGGVDIRLATKPSLFAAPLRAALSTTPVRKRRITMPTC